MKKSSIRYPVIAGAFYPAGPSECAHEVQSLFDSATVAERQAWIGAIIPHAGWVCSGQVAANAMASLMSAKPDAEVIVIFGAVHTVGGIRYGACDDHEGWQIPTGVVPVAQALQKKLLESAVHLRLDPRLHAREHSIEVNVPLIQYAWKDTPILPIEVPPVPEAVEIGRETARLLSKLAPNAVYLASSDMTHYGPNYGLTVAGEGERALRWATENDEALLAHVTALRGDEALAHTREHHSACGGGAIAALIGAATELGAKSARVLERTNSYEVLKELGVQERADNFVGYAAVGMA